MYCLFEHLDLPARIESEERAGDSNRAPSPIDHQVIFEFSVYASDHFLVIHAISSSSSACDEQV